MKRLWWIMGTAVAAQRTSAFMMLIEADGEGCAVTGCIKALGREWASAEVESIREIDPTSAYKADETLREAIETAQEKGFFLFLCDRPMN